MAATPNASNYHYWRCVFVSYDGREPTDLAMYATLGEARDVAAQRIRRMRFKGARVSQDVPGLSWEVENPNLENGDGLLTLYPV